MKATDALIRFCNDESGKGGREMRCQFFRRFLLAVSFKQLLSRGQNLSFSGQLKASTKYFSSDFSHE